MINQLTKVKRLFIVTIVTLFALTNSYSLDDSTFVPTTIYPNPFFDQVTIKHNKPLGTLYEISIYDAIGNTIYTFNQDEYQETAIIWDGKNQGGNSINPGTYICYIRTEDHTESILIRKF